MSDRPNLVIRASAGTGKTHRLTREYIERLGPETLSKLVLVTFTDNAAAELRVRISSALRRRLIECDSAIGNLLLTRERLPEARVSTLHTMCRNILAEHAPEIGLGPDPAVLDDRESRVWLDAAILESVIARLRRGDANLHLLLRQTRITSRSTYGEDFVGGIRRAYAVLTSRGIDIEDTLILPAPDDADLDRLERCLAGAGVSDPRASAAAIREALGRNDSEDADERLAAILDTLGCGRKRLPDAFAAACGCIGDLRLRLWRPLREALVRVARDSHERYRRRKRRAGRVDFDDMIRFVVDLLGDGDARSEIRRGMEEILVDEAQDLSRLQFLLLLRLWDPGANRLVVCGDRKQSIYGWRNADPTVLDDLEVKILDSSASGVEPLRRSYRSSGGIVGFVNAFANLVLAPSYDAASDDLIAQPDAVDPGLGPAVEWLDGGACDKQPTAADAAAVEADAIARRILALAAPRSCAPDLWAGPRRLVTRGVDGSPCLSDAGADNRVDFQDIVVLYRKRTHQAALERAFRHHGVPYAVERGLGIAECREVSDLLNALAAVADPGDALALAGTLRSPLFGVSDAGLLHLRSAGLLGERMFDPGEPLPAGLSDRDAGRAARARESLRRWRDGIHGSGFAALLERMVQETDVGAVLAALPQGEQRLANLRRTIELARDFDAGGTEGAGALIRQLRDAVGTETLEPQPQIVGGRRNVVRIMTIHLAKGLTFRVAVVPQCGVPPRDNRHSAIRLLDRPDGMTWVYNFRDPAGSRVGKTSLLLGEAAQDEKRRAAEEEGRLLYVAVTRAQDYLILSMPPQGMRRGPNIAVGPLEAVWTQRPDLVRRIGYGEIPQADAAPRGMGWEIAPGEAPPRMDPGRVVARATAGPGFIEPRGPWTVGVTSLLRLQRCVRWFWWTDVAGIPAPDDLSQERAPEPGDDEEPRPAAADLGTLGHAVLETIPLERPADWPPFIRRAVEAELPPGPARDQLRDALLALASAVLPRIAAGRAEREVPFLCRVEPPENASDKGLDRVMINGVIDALLRSDTAEESAGGTCEILDYKFSGRDPATLLEQYSAQLEIYALSVRRAGLMPARATLAQAAAGGCREIDVPLSDAILDARRDALARWIKRAIEIRRADNPPSCEDPEGVPIDPRACREILHCPFASLCNR